MTRPTQYHAQPMDPVHVPSIPDASFPLPPRLEGLRRLAYNLHWAWSPRTRNLWSLIDRTAWTRYRNPIPVISGPTNWSLLLDDEKFLAEYHDALAEFDEYMANGSDHWFQRKFADQLQGPIAYFCAEYGVHESLGIYSGGLGVLAGDHMKSASDMALPFVGVGLLYRKGYFRQSIDADGHQEHNYPDYDLSRLPLSRVQDENGLPLTVPSSCPGATCRSPSGWPRSGACRSCCWTRTSPRTPTRTARSPTSCTCAAARCACTRSSCWASAACAPSGPWACSPPSGTSTRATPRSCWPSGPASTWPPARPSTRPGRKVRRDSVFTIHTPVSAGNERFDADLVRRVAGELLEAGGVSVEPLLDLGVGMDGDRGQFDMTAFSLRLTHGANAVSKLHAETANGTWEGITDHPILAVTNGIHGPSWVGQPVLELLSKHLDADLDALDAGSRQAPFWEHLERVPDTDLWDAHLRQKRELAIFVRGRLRSQFARHGEAPSVLAELEQALDAGVMTIGFARRFATYKRAGLLFTDIDRLARLLWDADRPVQIVFAGKAHPADRPGQKVIQEIFQRSRSPQLRGRVFILEDYDIRVGRYLVQGVDVWLNNPRRPLEASGTSGMKAAQNGVPNISVLDGWWDEGYEEGNGWAIGGRETNPDEAAQDWSDAHDLYRLLEDDLIPRYYDRTGRPADPLGRRHAPLDGDDPLAVLHDAHAPGVHRAAVPAGGRHRGARARS